MPPSFTSEVESSIPESRLTDCPVRIYDVEGAHTTIIVPEDYARQLDQIRSERPSPESAQTWTGEPALPEDFLPHLRSLPYVGLLQRLYLLPETALDARLAWAEMAYRTPSTVVETAGEIVLFGPLHDEELPEILFYGWADILRERLNGVSRQFDLAAELEYDGFFVRDWAKKGRKENWSTHMAEALLSSDEDRLQAFVSAAPLRAVVLARALAWAFENRPFDEAGIELDVLKARIEKVQSEVLPAALTYLGDLVQSSDDAGERDFATRLLVYFGSPEPLPALKTVSNLDLSGEFVSDAELAVVRGMSDLEVLDLTDTLISKEGTEFLRDLSSLRVLRLGRTLTANSSLSCLNGLKNLAEFDLSNTYVGDGGLSQITGLTSLRKLIVRNTEVTEVGEAIMRRNIPNLEIVR